MNEQEINLIRTYVQLHYLIKDAVKSLEELAVSKVLMKNVAAACMKGFGSHMRKRMQETQRELRKLRIDVWIEDKEEELITVWTAHNMVKKSFMIKRKILREDMEKLQETLMEEMLTLSEEVKPIEYKPLGDRYS